MRLLPALLALSLSLPAAAGHDEPRELALRVDRLELREDPSGLALHYSFHKRELKQLRRAGLRAVLRVEVDGQPQRVRLDHRRGSLHLDCGPTPRQVRVSAVYRAGRGARAPLPLSLGGVLVDSVDLRVPGTRAVAPVVAPPPPPPRARAPDWSYDDATQRACRSAFWRGQGREACVQAVRAAVINPAPGVRACDRAFTRADDTLRCVRAVGRSPRDLSADVSACDRALVRNGNTASCVELTAARGAPIDRIAASCNRAFASDDRVRRCVESAGLSRVTDGQAEQAIARCADYYAGQRDTLMCVERALPGRVATR